MGSRKGVPDDAKRLKVANPKGCPANLTPAGKKTKLTDKMKMFIIEYMIDRNATAAMRRCGAPADKASSRAFDMMAHPLVKEEIARQMEELRKESKITHQYITDLLVSVIETPVSDFMEIVGEGDNKTIVAKNTDIMDPTKGKLIQSIKAGRRGVELTFISKKDAADMLARHVGYYQVDNEQKKAEGVQIYMPDNGRGDVVDSDNEEENG